MPIAENRLRILRGSESDSEIVFVIEDDYSIPSKEINGHRVISMTHFLSTPASERRYNIAIGNTAVRRRIASSIPTDLAKPFSIVASNHVSLHGNTVGEGAILCGFSHITSNVKIGKFFHGNIYSYVAHDCIIGDFVTFAPGVMCNGHVVIEDNAYIGTGVVIKDGTERPIVIGKGAVVGMGAVVTKSVPSKVTVIGNPARIMER
jgi:sugar O-acyltransferase (sialic acid O-acetyltransferase NeuD family)